MEIIRALLLVVTSLALVDAQSDCVSVSTKMDLGFAIDASGSIEFAGAWDNVRQFISDIIGSFDIGPDDVRVGAVKFSEAAQVEFLLNTYDTKADIQNFILNMPILGGRTNTQAALGLLKSEVFTRDGGDRRDAPNVVIVFTDGASNVLANNTVPNANLLKQDRVTIVTIGVRGGDDYNATELALIATSPDLYIERADFSELNAALLAQISEVVQDLCPPPPPGTICIKLKEKADVVFAVDRSISFNEMSQVRSFINNYVSQVNVGSDAVRLGLVAYSSTAVTMATMNQFTSVGSFSNVVNQLQATFQFDGVDLQAAFNQIETIFNGPNNRPDVENMVIMITDGGSTRNQPFSIPSVNAVKRLNVTFTVIGINHNGEYNATELDEVASVEELYLERSSYNDLTSAFITEYFDTVTSLCPVVETDCKDEFDLIIVLDASGSIGEAKYNQMKTFVLDVVRNLAVDQGRVKVGLMMFSDNTQRIFDLNRYSSVADMLTAISSMTYISKKKKVPTATLR